MSVGVEPSEAGDFDPRPTAVIGAQSVGSEGVGTTVGLVGATSRMHGPSRFQRPQSRRVMALPPAYPKAGRGMPRAPLNRLTRTSIRDRRAAGTAPKVVVLTAPVSCVRRG